MVIGVLLAAGLSTRMGEPKQLLPLRGRALCWYAARALAGAGFDALLAVVPPGVVGAGVRAALADLPFSFVENAQPGRGLGSSFRVAVQALPPGVTGVCFALADMPLVTAELHRALLSAFRESNAPVVLAEYGLAGEGPGVRAPPHLLRADVLSGVLTGPLLDHGPRELIGTHAAQAVTVRFPADWLLDVDTREDLAVAGAKLA